MGEDDNFWPAGAPTHGPNGVCGPCSEIFYHGDGVEGGRDLEPRLHPVQSRRARASSNRCPTRTSIPAWASNGWPPACRRFPRTSRSTSSSRSSPPRPRRSGIALRRRHARRHPDSPDRRPRPGLDLLHPRERQARPTRSKATSSAGSLRRAVLDAYQMGRREPFLLPARAGRRRGHGQRLPRTARQRSANPDT